MKHAFWLLIGMGLATAPHAQEIHKCLAGDAVAYQSAPCGDGQVEVRVAKLPDYADPPQRDGASAPSFDSPAAPRPTRCPRRRMSAASQRGLPFSHVDRARHDR